MATEGISYQRLVILSFLRRRLVSDILFTRVHQCETNGMLAAKVLSALFRKNVDYVIGLDDMLKRFITKKRGFENEASNLGSFFGVLYKERTLRIISFSHLRLSSEIVAENHLMLPFLKGLFQHMQRFHEGTESDVLNSLKDLFDGTTAADYETWLELHDGLLDDADCFVIRNQVSVAAKKDHGKRRRACEQSVAMARRKQGGKEETSSSRIINFLF